MATDQKARSESGIVHVMVAFFLMGGWAVFANSAHPLPTPLIAGAVQGTLSGVITFGLKRLVEHISRLSGSSGFGLVLPPLAAFTISASLLSLFHAVSGTPEILATMALPLTVSTGYAALYSWALWRRRRH